jgi:hypothetical protein
MVTKDTSPMMLSKTPPTIREIHAVARPRSRKYMSLVTPLIGMQRQKNLYNLPKTVISEPDCHFLKSDGAVIMLNRMPS